MGLLLLLMVVGFLVLMGVGGWVAIFWSASDAAKVKKMEAAPGETLDALFDGSPQVVYAPHVNSGGLTLPTLVRGAGEHGYRMVQESGRMVNRTVVFEKTASPAT
jgi:hypothetical protein